MLQDTGSAPQFFGLNSAKPHIEAWNRRMFGDD